MRHLLSGLDLRIDGSLRDVDHQQVTAVLGRDDDPVGPREGRIRMAKGGSWTTRSYAIYSGESDGNNPADLRDTRGFRLLVEID